MFECMPDNLKEQVRKYLEDDNFLAAKAVYDRWHQENQSSQESASVTKNTRH